MKKRSIALLGLLAVLLNSCVYSLFPIYTEDTLVFKEELLGKWSMKDGIQLLFESTNKDKENTTEENDYKHSVEIKEGFTMSSDEPIYIMKDGKKIYNKDSIRIIMLERMAKASDEEDNTDKNVSDLPSKDLKNTKDVEFSGIVSVYEDKSYKLTVVDKEGKKEAYAAHLVDIGGDLFMDLYPERKYNSENISDNFFPVHTFFKVKITKNEFEMIHFDMEKLNKLFESNRIRLRHENVDGTVLITAKPKELQKFIDTYSDDESVFDAVETYQRVSIK